MRLVKGLLERCTEVMAHLAVEQAGVSDIATALDLPKSATHRLLQELCRLGWVRQEADGRYGATLRFALLGSFVLQAAGLPDAAQPLLDRLARETRELVRLTMTTPDGLVWIASAQGAPAGLMYQPEMSGPVVLHATANGKALLATMTNADALALATRGGLGAVRPTARTIATRAALLADLARVRACAYAVAGEEAEPGVTAVAVAIRRGAAGPALGTVSVAGPSVRLPASRHGEIAAALADTARALSATRPFQVAQEMKCASD